MEREKLGSRLGFILLSAGCAIGIGNVYRFPYVTGQNGGGIFVLFYLIALVVMGLPVISTLTTSAEEMIDIETGIVCENSEAGIAAALLKVKKKSCIRFAQVNNEYRAEQFFKIID